MENSSKCKPVPACCLTCGNYKPQFYRVQNKECAAFGTLDRIKGDTCGAWCRKIDPPSTAGANV